MSFNPTESKPATATNDTPSKLRPPRTFVAPSAQPNTSNAAIDGRSSASQVSPGGRTLRKRRLGSSDESLSIKPEQAAKKVILQSNSSANTIKSNASVRTTSSLASARSGKQSLPSSSSHITSAGSKKMNYSSRPGWDTKGRLEDMEKILNDKLAQSEETGSRLMDAFSRIQELEKNREGLQNTVVVKETQFSHLTEELDKVKRELARTKEDAENELSTTKRKLLAQIEDLERERDSAKRELQKIEVELRCAIEENNGLKVSISRQSATLTELEARISSLKNSVETLEVSVKQKDESLLQSQAKEQSMLHRLQEMEEKLHSAERIRRKLHNDVLELKGNIRVFCRVRPLLPSDSTSKLDHIQFGEKSEGAESEGLTLLQASESATGQPVIKTVPFSFDRVFSPEATQSAVFDEISQLVQSSLDGYRVCIFAYGQTGSGKTHTMEGNRDAPGMIPLAVQQIFETAHRLASERQWMFTFEASYLEIYNETLRDLIEDGDKSLDIKHQNNKTAVSGLTYVQVESPEQVHNLLSKAAKNRAVAETQCNERSSRSHSVFTLNICGNNPATGESIEGILNLVDLAGSERLNQSGSVGDRLKETQAINKSLSALGDVIASLASKEAHVPFRNSKLTYLLQNSLGGNCKTLMFVNVNPSEASFGETLCSLRFATKVNNCQIGTARKMIKKE